MTDNVWWTATWRSRFPDYPADTNLSMRFFGPDEVYANYWGPDMSFDPTIIEEIYPDGRRTVIVWSKDSSRAVSLLQAEIDVRRKPD